VVTLVARNASEAMVLPMVGSTFKESLESGSRFYVGAFGSNLASAAMKMFSHFINFKNKFYKFCTLSAICKNNTAINCITVQHNKG
jgi:hypothetical protein